MTEKLIGIVCSTDGNGKITQAYCFENSHYHRRMEENGKGEETKIVYISPLYIKEVFYSGTGKEDGFDVELVESRRIR